MSQTSDTHVSSLGDYWSASDHSSVKSWSSENVKPTEERELELLASETLSLSGDDCGSTATPTFSDECEAPQAVAATGNSGRWGCVTHSVVPTAGPNCSRHIGLLSEIAKVEDVAKQLDFGSVTVLAQLGSHDATHHQTDAAAACGRSVLEDVESCTSKLKAAASQTLITLCSEDSDSDSSTSQLALQVNAASARPSSRRRAALDSDSESEELSRHCVNGATLPPQMPSTSVYNFDVSDSADTSDADIPDTDTGLRSPLEAPAPVRAGYQPEQGRSVIVLDSFEDDNAASCRPHSYLLCSSDSDEELGAAHKENLSPNQLALRMHSLHIKTPHTSVKPPKPPSTAPRPRAPQLLPPKAKHSLLLPSSPVLSKAPSLATFKKQREGLAYQMFQELNTAVFDERLPADLQISWNVHLKTTAGLTHYSRISLAGRAPRYTARVELSTKVVDNLDKLQRTLCHELCHVATWLLDHVAKPPHGPHFKAWAAAAMKVHPHLNVTTCHQYDIHFAWRWQCSNPECLQMYKRHSNSIDPTKQICSSCRGQLHALGRFNSDGTPAKARAPSQYSLFVKENFASHKQSCGPGTPHKEIMRALSCSWKARATASESIEFVESEPAAVLSFAEASSA